MTKYNIGDEIEIYEPVNGCTIKKKVEAVCYSAEGIFYITDPVDLYYLGIDEKTLNLPNYQINNNELKRKISDTINDTSLDSLPAFDFSNFK